MTRRPKNTQRFGSSLLIFLLAFGSPIGMSQDAKAQKRKSAQAPSQNTGAKKLTDEQKVVHLLDRATFGARPGDIERVMKLGWEKFLDEQLHPDRISDQAIDEKLKNIE